MSEIINRRDFLMRLAGTGALIATAQLPLFGDETPAAAIPTRHSSPRLSLSYGVVELGLEEPFSLLHISDSHLTEAYDDESEKDLKWKAKRSQLFGQEQEAALIYELEWAKQHVEFIVHTGDIIDWQDRANLDLMEKYLGRDFIGCVGNHEYKVSTEKYQRTEEYKSLGYNRLRKYFPKGVLFASQVVHGVNFITMDNVFGYVTEDQIWKFEAEVKKRLPIVLCLHVPIFTKNLSRTFSRFWRESAPEVNPAQPAPGRDEKQQLQGVTKDFIEYLKSEPLLKCILAGHWHFTAEDQFSPTCREYVVAGGYLWHAREVLFI